MTTSNKAATKATAEKAAVPALAKAKAQKLAGLVTQFTSAEGDRVSLADAQRRTIMAMVEVGSFDQCWPTIEQALGSVWSETTAKISKSQFGLYWKARANAVAFPETEKMGWQAYAKGPLKEALQAAGVIETRAPRAGGNATKAKAEAAKGAKAEAATIVKVADSVPDMLAAMIELANRTAVKAEGRAMASLCGDLKDLLADMQALVK